MGGQSARSEKVVPPLYGEAAAAMPRVMAAVVRCAKRSALAALRAPYVPASSAGDAAGRLAAAGGMARMREGQERNGAKITSCAVWRSRLATREGAGKRHEARVSMLWRKQAARRGPTQNTERRERSQRPREGAKAGYTPERRGHGTGGCSARKRRVPKGEPDGMVARRLPGCACACGVLAVVSKEVR